MEKSQKLIMRSLGGKHLASLECLIRSCITEKYILRVQINLCTLPPKQPPNDRLHLTLHLHLFIDQFEAPRYCSNQPRIAMSDHIMNTGEYDT